MKCDYWRIRINIADGYILLHYQMIDRWSAGKKSNWEVFQLMIYKCKICKHKLCIHVIVQRRCLRQWAVVPLQLLKCLIASCFNNQCHSLRQLGRIRYHGTWLHRVSLQWEEIQNVQLQSKEQHMKNTIPAWYWWQLRQKDFENYREQRGFIITTKIMTIKITMITARKSSWGGPWWWCGKFFEVMISRRVKTCKTDHVFTLLCFTCLLLK